MIVFVVAFEMEKNNAFCDLFPSQKPTDYIQRKIYCQNNFRVFSEEVFQRLLGGYIHGLNIEIYKKKC